MDLGYKNRLIGALVILLLAVVVLPQLFDGSGRIPDRVTAIPPVFKKPDVSSIESIDRSLYSRQEQAGAFNVSMDYVETTLISPAVEQINTLPMTEQKTVTSSDHIEEIKLPSKKDPVIMPDRLGQVEAPELRWKGKRAEVFSIQIGSFSDASNAQKLLLRVREAGHKAYILTNKNNQGSMSQVLVGPIASMDRANQVAQQLKIINGVSSPWVMKYKAVTNLKDVKR